MGVLVPYEGATLSNSGEISLKVNLTPKSQNERLWWLLGKPVGIFASVACSEEPPQCGGKGKMLDEETILSQGPKDNSYSKNYREYLWIRCRD
jgi:hypothetical protein